MLANCLAGYRRLREKVGEVEKQPQIEAWVAQCHANPLLSALADDSDQVLDVLRLNPMVRITNKPKLISLANLILVLVFNKSVYHVLR